LDYRDYCGFGNPYCCIFGSFFNEQMLTMEGNAEFTSLLSILSAGSFLCFYLEKEESHFKLLLSLIHSGSIFLLLLFEPE